MKIVYLLNHPNDIPTALLLHRTCPKDIKLNVILMNFRVTDKHNWSNRIGKGKWLERAIQEHDLTDVKKLYNSNDIIDCTSESQFNSIIGKEKSWKKYIETFKNLERRLNNGN